MEDASRITSFYPVSSETTHLTKYTTSSVFRRARRCHDYPEERPEEEPGRDYPSDLEENGIFLYNDPEEHNSDPEEIDVETLMLY